MGFETTLSAGSEVCFQQMADRVRRSWMEQFILE